MKYIKAKDGIYKIYDETETYYECSSNHYVSKNILGGKSNCVLADTIEELCDEFVVIVQNNGCILFNQCLNSFEKVVSLNQKAKDNDAKIYGAIWTDKGLIYVAKINDKGGLELL